MIPHKSPPHILHLSFLKRLLGVKKGTDTAACSVKQVRCPFFLWVQMHQMILEQFTLLEKVVRADLLVGNGSDADLSGSAHTPHSTVSWSSHLKMKIAQLV